VAGERWVTFDCYGTLIDWNGGIRGELARVFGEERADEQLERYHELEPELEADGTRSYREVLTEAMRRLGAPAGEEDALARSLPQWEPFPEVS
jgi:FMN phosphatase YigB (HAD superfamily)